MRKEFILNTLIKYKEDRSKCASNGVVNCVYLHPETGNKCAVGEHLIDGEHQQFAGSVDRLFEKYGCGILTQEAQEQQIPVNVWMEMQQYHDSIAYYGPKSKELPHIVERLELKTGFEFPELLFN